MFELTINGRIYQFNFGMGFMKDIDPTVTKKIDGVNGKVQNLGLQYAIGGIMDGDVITLADVLIRANKGFEPRLQPVELERHIEDANTDIDKLFTEVMGFFENSNVTRKMYLNMKEAVEAEKAKNEQKNNG